MQECGVGLVPIRREEGTERLAFAAPALLTDEPVPADDLAAIVAALGVPDEAVLDHRVLDNGPGWRVVLLDSAARVTGLTPDWSRLRAEHPDLSVGVAGLHGDDGGPDGTAVEVRGFALAMGIPRTRSPGASTPSSGSGSRATGACPAATSPPRAPRSAGPGACTSSVTAPGPSGSAGRASRASRGPSASDGSSPPRKTEAGAPACSVDSGKWQQTLRFPGRRAP